MKTGRAFASTFTVLGLWFAAVLTASALHVYKVGSEMALMPPLPLGLSVVVPIFVFLIAYGTSRTFREFILSLDPRILTIVQAWRIGGIVFVILQSVGHLPALFALPAGLGDFAIGITAPLVANHLLPFVAYRKSFLTWHALGVLDLVVAVAMGVLTSRGPIGLLTVAVPSDLMTVLPLSLIPTFAVPLLTICHLIVFAQWRNGRLPAYSRAVQAMA
jgi:hypothetical protein